MISFKCVTRVLILFTALGCGLASAETAKKDALLAKIGGQTWQCPAGSKFIEEIDSDSAQMHNLMSFAKPAKAFRGCVSESAQGVPNGRAALYSETGVVLEDGEYKNGKRFGEHVSRSPSGKIVRRSTFLSLKGDWETTVCNDNGTAMHGIYKSNRLVKQQPGNVALCK